MKKFLLNLVIISIFFLFVYEMKSLNLVAFLLIFTFFSLVIFKEVFEFSRVRSLLRIKAFYKGILKKLLSGRVFVTFRSLFWGFVLGFILVFNAISFNKFEFLFVVFAFPLLFFSIKFFILNLSKNTIKFANILSKTYSIYICAFLLCLIWGAISFYVVGVDDKISGDIFDFLSLQSVDRSFNPPLINEIYSYSFYTNSLSSWVFDKYKIAWFVAIFINKFMFFASILYTISFLSSKNSYKCGYFLGVILLLAYIYISFIVANSLNLMTLDMPKQEDKG